MNGDRPDVTIVIVSWNTRDLLVRCLASLQATAEGLCPAPVPELAFVGRATDPAYLVFGAHRARVVVIDNASSDGTIELVASRFPWVYRVASAENLGFARANNRVMRDAVDTYVLLLNPDTEVCPGALQALLAFMDAHPQAGAAGARLLNTDGTLQFGCFPLPTPEREFWRLLFLDQLISVGNYRMAGWSTSESRRVDVIKGACLLLRRRALDEVGLLDESYFMYTEEVDLCYRLALAGWHRWYVPSAVVIHHGEGSSRQIAQPMYVQLYRSKTQFYRKFGGEWRATRFKWFLRLAYWPRLAAGTAAAALRPSLAAQTRTWRQLLAELSGM